jgi:hypothetical protein
MRPKNRGNLLVPTPLGPGERRRPRLVVAQADGGSSRQQELDHLWSVGARGPGQRRRAIIVVSGCNRCASIEQDGGVFDRVPRGRVVKQRLVLPVHLVRAHPVREQVGLLVLSFVLYVGYTTWRLRQQEQGVL